MQNSDDVLFENLSNNQSFLSASVALNYFFQSGVSSEDLDKILKLIGRTNNRQWNISEFSVICGLIKILHEQKSIPGVLPHEMYTKLNDPRPSLRKSSGHSWIGGREKQEELKLMRSLEEFANAEIDKIAGNDRRMSKSTTTLMELKRSQENKGLQMTSASPLISNSSINMTFSPQLIGSNTPLSCDTFQQTPSHSVGASPYLPGNTLSNLVYNNPEAFQSLNVQKFPNTLDLSHQSLPPPKISQQHQYTAVPHNLVRNEMIYPQSPTNSSSISSFTVSSPTQKSRPEKYHYIDMNSIENQQKQQKMVQALRPGINIEERPRPSSNNIPMSSACIRQPSSNKNVNSSHRSNDFNMRQTSFRPTHQTCDSIPVEKRITTNPITFHGYNQSNDFNKFKFASYPRKSTKLIFLKISEATKAYVKKFMAIQQNIVKNGKILKSQMKKVLKIRNIKERDIDQILELCDIDYDNEFDEDEVNLIFHLTECHESGITLPKVLPQELIPENRKDKDTESLYSAANDILSHVCPPQNAISSNLRVPFPYRDTQIRPRTCSKNNFEKPPVMNIVPKPVVSQNEPRYDNIMISNQSNTPIATKPQQNLYKPPQISQDDYAIIAKRSHDKLNESIRIENERCRKLKDEGQQMKDHVLKRRKDMKVRQMIERRRLQLMSEIQQLKCDNLSMDVTLRDLVIGEKMFETKLIALQDTCDSISNSISTILLRIQGVRQDIIMFKNQYDKYIHETELISQTIEDMSHRLKHITATKESECYTNKFLDLQNLLQNANDDISWYRESIQIVKENLVISKDNYRQLLSVRKNGAEYLHQLGNWCRNMSKQAATLQEIKHASTINLSQDISVISMTEDAGSSKKSDSNLKTHEDFTNTETFENVEPTEINPSIYLSLLSDFPIDECTCLKAGTIVLASYETPEDYYVVYQDNKDGVWIHRSYLQFYCNSNEMEELFTEEKALESGEVIMNPYDIPDLEPEIKNLQPISDIKEADSSCGESEEERNIDDNELSTKPQNLSLSESPDKNTIIEEFEASNMESEQFEQFFESHEIVSTCIVLYDLEKTDQYLGARTGDIIATFHVQDGWYFGYLNGEVGYFPEEYTQSIDLRDLPIEPQPAQVVCDFNAQNSLELSLKKDSNVIVHYAAPGNYSYLNNPSSNEFGWCPTEFLRCPNSNQIKTSDYMQLKAFQPAETFEHLDVIEPPQDEQVDEDLSDQRVSEINVDEETPKKMSKSLHILNEFNQCNMNYMKDLILLNSTFVTELHASGDVSPDSINIMFPDVDEIIVIFKQQIEIFNHAISKSSDIPSNLGNLFLEFIDQCQPIFNLAVKCLVASQIYHKEFNCNKKFSQAVRRFENEQQILISDCVVRPVQFIARIPLFLSKLIKQLDSSYNELQEMQKAFEESRKKVEETNERIKIGQNEVIMHWLPKKLNLSEFSLNDLTGKCRYFEKREFIHHEHVILFKTRKRAVLCLFNDLILLVKFTPETQDKFPFYNDSHVKLQLYKRPFDLLNCKVTLHEKSQTYFTLKIFDIKVDITSPSLNMTACKDLVEKIAEAAEHLKNIDDALNSKYSIPESVINSPGKKLIINISLNVNKTMFFEQNSLFFIASIGSVMQKTSIITANNQHNWKFLLCFPIYNLNKTAIYVSALKHSSFHPDEILTSLLLDGDELCNLKHDPKLERKITIIPALICTLHVKYSAK